MNDKIEIKPQVVSPLKKICMSIGELPTSYLETMTYYEMLIWFTNYLRDTIIPVVNNNGEAVTELQNLFVELQTYVNDYFDNLDVQEEINNKLDEMLEDGQLEQIIEQYLQSSALWTFDTVANMKLAENLVNGSYVKTLGFHSKNDKGGAVYKIRTITNDDIVNEKDIIAVLDDSLVAELIITSEMCVNQFGAYGDGTHDDSEAINCGLSKNIILTFDSKTYKISSIINLNNDTLIGNNTEIKAIEFTGNIMLSITNNVTIKNIKFNCNNICESVISDTSTGNNLIIDNCEFTNSKANTNNDGFSLTSCVYLTANNCVVTNSKFNNNNSHGCRLNATSSNTKIKLDNCEFSNNGSESIDALGLVQYGPDNGLLYDSVVITNCKAFNNSKSGIAPHSANNVFISNCVSNNNGEHGFCLMDGKNGTITNCEALNNSYYGVRVQGDFNNSTNPGYEKFIISNNYFKGGGVYADYHVKQGIISNNLIVRDTMAETPKGIKLGSGSDNQNRIPIKELTITNNVFKGYDGNNELISFVNIDDTNKCDGNKFENLPSPKAIGYTTAYSLFSGNKNDFIIGNTENAIEDTIFNTGWSAAGGGTISGNTLTPSSTGNLLWKTIDYTGEKYLCVYFDISGYPTTASYGVNLRTRNSGGSLIGEKSFPYQRMIGNKLIVLFDMANTQFDFTNVAKLDIMFAGSSNSQITVNSCYACYTNDLPHLLNKR